jgi:hypothetical protein
LRLGALQKIIRLLRGENSNNLSLLRRMRKWKWFGLARYHVGLRSIGAGLDQGQRQQGSRNANRCDNEISPSRRVPPEPKIRTCRPCGERL